MTFPRRLEAAVRRAKTPLCVGVDPWPQRLPGVRGLSPSPGLAGLALYARAFCRAVVDAAADRVPAIKPQFAFFEALGPQGMEVLAWTCRRARDRGLLVIGDAKRGDIGSTAAAYATATLTDEAPFPCDALTLNPFLGPDAMQPFIEAAGEARGVFVLLRTSNAGADRWQAPVAEDLAGWIDARNAPGGYGNVGAVVGATRPDVLAEHRARLPRSWLLVPGFGAQGASAQEARRALDPDGLGALIVSARAATFPDGFDPEYEVDAESWMARRIDEVKRSLS
jgi:orotidine-5'-phosphate decarboxylase